MLIIEKSGGRRRRPTLLSTARITGSGSETFSRIDGHRGLYLAEKLGYRGLDVRCVVERNGDKVETLSAIVLVHFRRSGNSSRQGSHQVAQKLTSSGFVCVSLASSFLTRFEIDQMNSLLAIEAAPSSETTSGPTVEQACLATGDQFALLRCRYLSEVPAPQSWKRSRRQ